MVVIEMEMLSMFEILNECSEMAKDRWLQKRNIDIRNLDPGEITQ